MRDTQTYFPYGNAAARTFGRAHRHRPYAFCLRELHVDVRPLRKIVHQGRICCHLCAGVALSFGVEKAVFIFICIFASNKNVNQEQSWNV